MKENILVIFGGQDPEEQAARTIARVAGCVLATAVTADGKKVHAGNAYQATGYAVDEGGDLAGVTGVVIFECAPAVAGELPVVARCDHHNPGDAGYGLPAAEYWQASSLGQLCVVIGTEPTDDLRMVAAGDHCPADAYAGRCPGVDPAAFAAARISGKVAFYATNPRTADKAAPEKIQAAIEAAKVRLLAAPIVDGVRDLRDAGEVDELPEAALASGLAYMAAIPDVDRDRQPTGNTKIVLGGHTTPETVERFLGWAKTLANRVGEPYGNPVRGFAGVVVKP
ncbi:MAG: hypothetical protein HGA33_00745 [Candidatus Moranbacteria bacterium]|nr:hypothetical protein [Candidatus Moranbacteria bacterium]